MFRLNAVDASVKGRSSGGWSSDGAAGGFYDRLVPMRHRSSRSAVARPVARACVAIAAVLPIAGCTSASVGDVQKQISKGLNQQLQSEAPSSEEHISTSVTCPKNVSLRAGSVFYCEATVTKFPLNSPAPSSGSNPGNSSTQSTRRQVVVTIENSSKAHWVLQ